MNERRRIEGVLFDMDGVLVDSKDAWYQALREASGGEMSSQEFEERYWGRDLEANLQDFDGAPESGRFCDRVFQKHLDRVRPSGGVHDVLERIALPIALVTNTTAACTEGILDRFGLGDAFDAVVTPDSVLSGKPSPYPVLRACALLKLRPEQTLLIGDSPHDIEAGRKAGALTVGLGIDGDHRVEQLCELLAIVRDLGPPGAVAPVSSRLGDDSCTIPAPDRK